MVISTPGSLSGIAEKLHLEDFAQMDIVLANESNVNTVWKGPVGAYHKGMIQKPFISEQVPYFLPK